MHRNSYLAKLSAGICQISDLLQALIGVADRSLMEIPDIDAPLRQNIAEHMAFVHLQVAEESKR